MNKRPLQPVSGPATSTDPLQPACGAPIPSVNSPPGPLFGHHGPASGGRGRHLRDQSGSVLVVLVIGLTVVATLGAAMSLFSTSSLVLQTGSTDFIRAYYLAEAGGRYAIKQIVDLEYGGGSPPTDAQRTALVASLDDQTFTLADGSTFTLDLTYSDYLYTLTSTGDTTASASRAVIYEINVYRPPGGASGTPIPFTTASPGSSQLDPDDWNTTGSPQVSGDTLLMKGSTPVTVSFDWNNSSSSLPDLLDVWLHSDNLLTYEIQAKFNLTADDVVTGISFRLDTDHDTDPSNDEFYGYSLVDVGSGGTLPSFVDRDGDPVSFSSGAQYLMLWKQEAGVKTVLEMIPAPSALLLGSDFDNPTSLIIRVQEQYQSPGVRENLITAYYADTSYSYGTISWDYSDFSLVQWSGCDSANDCSAAGDCSCIVDTSLTSENFSTRLPDEIGLHALGGTAFSKSEVQDLAIRFNFNAGTPTRY